MSISFLDPTHETNSNEFKSAPRLTSLDNATVAIVSNGKKNTIPFFDAMELDLRTKYGVANVIRITKHNYSAPVDKEQLNEASQWDALIAGIGD